VYIWIHIINDISIIFKQQKGSSNVLLKKEVKPKRSAGENARKNPKKPEVNGIDFFKIVDRNLKF